MRLNDNAFLCSIESLQPIYPPTIRCSIGNRKYSFLQNDSNTCFSLESANASMQNFSTNGTTKKIHKESTKGFIYHLNISNVNLQAQKKKKRKRVKAKARKISWHKNGKYSLFFPIIRKYIQRITHQNKFCVVDVVTSLIACELRVRNHRKFHLNLEIGWKKKQT